MDEYKNIMIFECYKLPIKSKIRITGAVKKKNKINKMKSLVLLEDITGAIKVSFEKNRLNEQTSIPNVDTRVRIYGYIAKNDKGEFYITDVDKVEHIDEIGKRDNIDKFDQEALFLTSYISNLIKNSLNISQFQEIKTRVISRYLGDDVLEPLLVKYPGFASEAYLSPSPSSQLSEFLTNTLIPKVFTDTISFTSSYRFKNASSEMPLIMAKAINMHDDEEKQLIEEITKKVLKALGLNNFHIKIIKKEWSEVLKEDIQKDTYLLGFYTSNLPVVGEKWNSIVTRIFRLTDCYGNLLVEGTHEMISPESSLSTISFFPAQYLSSIQKAPKRVLQNLWVPYGSKKPYK